MGSLNAIAALFGPLTGSVSLEVAAVCLLDRWRGAVVVLLAHVDTASIHEFHRANADAKTEATCTALR